jgi:transposase-like protein
MEIQEIKCRYCKSSEVIKYGNRYNKSGKTQIYKCKSCKKIFSDNTTFPKMKHKGEIITIALDLYFKNVSLRGIKDHLRQIYGVKVSHVTILYWIRKYSRIFKEFTDKLKGESSGVLHADEMMVNINGEWYCLWNIIDKETKLITASKLARARYQKDVIELFKETKSKLVNKPKVVITDGLQAYDKAIRKVFWRHPQTKHVWST